MAEKSDPLMERLDGLCAMAQSVTSRLDAIERKDAAERITRRKDSDIDNNSFSPDGASK